jgi:hypothetical protein
MWKIGVNVVHLEGIKAGDNRAFVAGVQPLCAQSQLLITP